MRYIVILLCCCYIACKQPANKPIEIVSDGVHISYNVCGTGDTALLFLHGWGINKTYWAGQLKYFCPSYKVVAIDLPGFGESGKNRQNWSFDAYTEDVKAVIDQLQLKHVILIGHSMSGDIILNTDNKYPSLLAGIVGIDNLHEPGHPLSEAEKKQTDTFLQMMATHFDSTVNMFLKPGVFQPTTDTSIVSRVMNDVLSSDSLVALQVMRSLMVAGQKEQSRMQQLSHILYVVNSDVVPIKADSLAKYCKHGCKAELIHATGHYPMLEKPDSFNIALQKVIYEIGKNK
ncbi:MAG: alpha/beta hydrolase [Agriterribacter sp.]